MPGAPSSRTSDSSLAASCSSLGVRCSPRTPRSTWCSTDRPRRGGDGRRPAAAAVGGSAHRPRVRPRRRGGAARRSRRATDHAHGSGRDRQDPPGAELARREADRFADGPRFVPLGGDPRPRARAARDRPRPGDPGGRRGAPHGLHGRARGFSSSSTTSSRWSTPLRSSRSSRRHRAPSSWRRAARRCGSRASMSSPCRRFAVDGVRALLARGAGGRPGSGSVSGQDAEVRRASAPGSTGYRWRSSWRRRARRCSARLRSSTGSSSGSTCSRSGRATPRRASAPCAPRSAGATSCSPRRSGRCSAELGVFVGGFSLETEAVWGPGALDGITRAGGPEPGHAQRRSLRDVPRSIRAFALEQLAEAGGLEGARRATPPPLPRSPRRGGGPRAGIRGPAQARWFARLDADASTCGPRPRGRWPTATPTRRCDWPVACCGSGPLAGRSPSGATAGHRARRRRRQPGAARQRIAGGRRHGGRGGRLRHGRRLLQRRPGSGARGGRPRPCRAAPEQPGDAGHVRRRPRAGGPLRGGRRDRAPARRPAQPEPGHPEPRHRVRRRRAQRPGDRPARGERRPRAPRR